MLQLDDGEGSTSHRAEPRPAAVTAAVHPPALGHRPKALAPVLLLPGAGGSLDSAPLVALAEVAAAAGALVVRANLPHHERGGRAPRASTSVPAVAAILQATRNALGNDPALEDDPAFGIDPTVPWVLGGRSYGARVASLAIADGLPVAGLVCSGYPLHPPGRPDKLRVAHWPQVAVPVLLIQGDADPMADLVLLEQHRHKLPRRSTLLVVPGGDHALRVTRARSPDGTARSPALALQQVADQVAAWLAGLGVDPDGIDTDGQRTDA